MTPNRAANNRVLAEWCGWKCLKNSDDELQWHHPACSCVAMRPEDPCACHDGCYWFDGEDVPDFYESEAANAMLRSALPVKAGFSMTIQIDPNGHSMVDGLGIPAVFAADYKTAICNAALALINQEKS